MLLLLLLLDLSFGGADVDQLIVVSTITGVVIFILKRAAEVGARW